LHAAPPQSTESELKVKPTHARSAVHAASACATVSSPLPGRSSPAPMKPPGICGAYAGAGGNAARPLSTRQPTHELAPQPSLGSSCGSPAGHAAGECTRPEATLAGSKATVMATAALSLLAADTAAADARGPRYAGVLCP